MNNVASEAAQVWRLPHPRFGGWFRHFSKHRKARSPLTHPSPSQRRFMSPWMGLQLSVVRKKLNVVANGGRRKLNVVADGTPEKGRRYSTFIHTERALVAIFNLSDHINQNI